MKDTRILVTGAAGKTGAAVVQQLLERDFTVRALVRIRDERAARLGVLGAEIVEGDLHEFESMRSAMQGVQRVYFVYPPQGKQLVEASTIAAVHVRPTFFAENLLMFGAATVASEGKLYLPFGSEKHAPVSAADIARVVVGILSAPDDHVGQRYVLTGPRNLSITEMAEILSRELGKPVEYVDLPVEAWGQVLAGVDGMSDSLVTHLKAVAVDHQNGIFRGETDVVERIGGQPTQSLEAFVHEHRALFGATQAVAS
jgi:uncharacterized protein YbjT (DUF2867 family)